MSENNPVKGGSGLECVDGNTSGFEHMNGNASSFEGITENTSSFEGKNENASSLEDLTFNPSRLFALNFTNYKTSFGKIKERADYCASNSKFIIKNGGNFCESVVCLMVRY